MSESVGGGGKKFYGSVEETWCLSQGLIFRFECLINKLSI